MDQAAELRRDAYREGREQGHADGAAAAHAEVADALALVQQITLQAKVLRDRLLREAERDMLELVVACVEAILGDQVRAEPGLVLATVEHALLRAGAQNIVRIRVNPRDGQAVSARFADAAGDASASWEVTSDGAVGVGGCVIDTESGQVDARLDVQLEEIARSFRAACSDEVGRGTPSVGEPGTGAPGTGEIAISEAAREATAPSPPAPDAIADGEAAADAA